MNDTELKTLNEKLLIFVGFIHDEDRIDKKLGGFYRWWKFPQNKNEPYWNLFDSMPDLVNSLDAQAKWIYPKLAETKCRITKDYSPRKNLWTVTVYTADDEGMYEDSNEALAFAKATEKYIDSLEKTK